MHRLRRKRLKRTFWKKLQRGFRGIFHLAFIINHLVIGSFLLVAAWMYVFDSGALPPPPSVIDSNTVVKSDTLLVITLDRTIYERSPVNSENWRTIPLSREQIVKNLRKAARDPRISGILLHVENPRMTISTALDIHEELRKFRQSEKRIIAYLEQAGLQTYFLVSMADTIIMPPAGDLNLMGLRAEIPFYKALFDKLGVTPEFVALGKYKTAPQIFTMDHLSDEYREVINSILDEYYHEYVDHIALARGVSAEQIKEWIDGGLYSASSAKTLGMIDNVLYEDQLEAFLKTEFGIEEQKRNDETAEDKKPTFALRTIEHVEYAQTSIRVPRLYESGAKIAVVYARGTIVSGESSSAIARHPRIGSQTLSDLLFSLAENEEIEGVILRLDSGGGSARASDLIRHAVEELRQKKPIVVSMADMAASGGYMIAAPANSIVAYPLTMTGSIGVFGGKFSLRGLYDLIGLNIEAVQRGEHAGLFTEIRPFSASEHELFHDRIQEEYRGFLTKVAEGRQMAVEQVESLAQGRVWTGRQAFEHGLVDRLGGLDTAVDMLKEYLELDDDDDIRLINYPRSENVETPFYKRWWNAQLTTDLPEEIQQLQEQLTELTLLQEDRLFAWFPCRISVQ